MCVCVSAHRPHRFFAIEGDVHMKRVNKKWQRGQEGIVVGGSRRTAEFQTESEGRRDGARGAGQ